MGEKGYREVARLFRNETKRWCTVTVETAEGSETITSTLGHKYYLPDNTENREISVKQEHESYNELSEKWVSACKLRMGDKVLLSDGKCGIIEDIRVEELTEAERTYNFEVEEYHTYYVGKAGVCVHNNNCYTYENGIYEDAPYHTSKGNSVKSPRPIDGQAALDNSVQIKPTSSRRLGYSKKQFVILDQTRPGIYHGHVPKIPHKEQLINNLINKWRF